MSYQTYRTWRSALAVVIGVAGAAAVLLGIVYILLAALIMGMVILVAMRRRVTGVISDERTHAIAYKAARLTMAIVAVGLAVIGSVLLALANRQFASTLAQAGFALEYGVGALLIVYYLAYYYYSRKLGGKE